MRTWSWTLTLVSVAAVAVGCGGSESTKPGSGAPKATPAETKPPLVPKKAIADWCGEHGVPESVCTLCNDGLIREFMTKGDWCEEHAIPASQCIACDPSLEAKFKAMAPK